MIGGWLALKIAVGLFRLAGRQTLANDLASAMRYDIENPLQELPKPPF